MIKIEIAKVAEWRGFKNACALQKALKCSPTMASKLWKGTFEQIRMSTLSRLCDLLRCEVSDLLIYSSDKGEDKGEIEKAVGQPRMPKPVEVKLERAGRIVESFDGDKYTLATKDVASQLGLNPRTVREKAKRGELHGKQGRQNQWFFRQMDVDDYVVTGSESNLK